jgi:hypothetical protein
MAIHSYGRCAVMMLTMVLGLIVADRARAEDFERIRPESPLLKEIIASTVNRSVTFRSIVEQIERSNVIVYMTCTNFDHIALTGQTLLVSAQSDVRYLRVQIRCAQLDRPLITAVAHELQHVFEIAATPWVVDDRSFAALFSTIGFTTCPVPPFAQFETKAALETGRQVYSEFHSHSNSLQASRRTKEVGERRNGD